MGAFRDKVAIVTGGGSGIGRALCQELARRGARVTAADINPQRAEETAESVLRSGGKCTAAPLDVTDASAVDALIADVVEQHGRVDYMFNNAGIGVGGQARDLALQDWRDVIEVNLFGVINGIRAVYPQMIKQGSGHIVNTSSVEGLVPFASNLPYTASKFAVVGLSQGLRTEAEPLGVKVSVVCPGYTDTPIFTESRVVNLDRDRAAGVVGNMKPMSPQECVKVMLRGVARNQPIIVISDAGRFAWFMSRLSPELSRKILASRLKILLDARIQS